MKNTFRKTVMLRAYHIMNVNGLSWSESLKKAWQLYKLNKDLHTGKVSFYFEKKDGEIRKANATLKIDYEFKKESQPNPKIFTYFDVDAQSFRCFKIENFIMIEPAAETKLRAISAMKKSPAKLIRIRRKQFAA